MRQWECAKSRWEEAVCRQHHICLVVSVGSASIYNGIITAPRTPRPNLDSIINESSNLGRALTLVLRRKWHIDGPLSEQRVGRDRYLRLRACGRSDGLRASQIPSFLMLLTVLNNFTILRFLVWLILFIIAIRLCNIHVQSTTMDELYWSIILSV